MAKDYIESESTSTSRITNSQLICKDCMYRFDDTKIFKNTTRCGAYTLKPNKVLCGKECPKYKKEK